jgi:hypothetical protein
MNDEPYYRYILSGLPNVSYSESELIPSQKKIERFKVKKIIDDKMIGNKKYYLVWWLGYKKKESTWEPSKNLIKDGLKEYIDEYENNN